MNKLFVLSLLIGLSTIVQAAQVKWTSGGSDAGFLDHAGNPFDSSSSYIMSVYFYSDAGITPFGSVSTSSKAVDMTGEYKANPDGFTLSTAESTVTYYCKAVITGKDGADTWTRESTLAAFDMPTTGNKNLNFYAGSGFATSGNKWGEWQAVPEPFSGSLALLGVGLVALRRRMKKAKKA